MYNKPRRWHSHRYADNNNCSAAYHNRGCGNVRMGSGPFSPNPGQYNLKAGKGSTSAVERAEFAFMLLGQTFNLLEEIRTSDRIMMGHSIWCPSCLLHSHSQGNRPYAQRSRDDPFPRWRSSYLDLTLISSFPGHPFLSQGI